MLRHRIVRRAPPLAQYIISRSTRCVTSGSSDLFALLKTERLFDLDEQHLHRMYKKAMSAHHPDLFSRCSELEQQHAANRAAEVTNAYNVLKMPHTRATYLLELLGKPITEEAEGVELSSQFLLEVMEIREELESCPSQEQLRLLGARNDIRVASVHAALARAFAANEVDSARTLTAQLQYLVRIGAEINKQRDIE
mmetsp:Transcript_14160/g.23568  ORF Transcript_14160/g.23568 Transcript_14160/m.23568 type:complete len:196 (-) Transcript_14160:103-690(-)